MSEDLGAMPSWVELLNSALKHGITYGVFFILFCSAALFADAQGHIQLATLGAGARTTVILVLIAAAILTAIALANRAGAFVWPQATALYRARREQAEWNAKIAAADAEVLANYEVLPEREKLLLALVMHKGNRRFHIERPTNELYGLWHKQIIHLPQGSRARDIFVVRENIWQRKDALLAEMKGQISRHLNDISEPVSHARRGGWSSGLEL